MKKILHFFRLDFVQHLLFWLGVFLYFIVTVGASFPMSTRHLVEVYGMVVGLQIIAAYTCIYILLPRYLNKGRWLAFGLSLFALLIGLLMIYIFVRINYLEMRYTAYYESFMADYMNLGFWERLNDPSMFVGKSVRTLTPLALMLLIGFYRSQKKFLQINEQKKVAELSALKNQLNPHFLFNTLNNLYALAIKKAEETPEVISRLSDIL
ncbi:MAG: histidine kinase, partial [Bacteroidota bacterium]